MQSWGAGPCPLPRDLQVDPPRGFPCPDSHCMASCSSPQPPWGQNHCGCKSVPRNLPTSSFQEKARWGQGRDQHFPHFPCLHDLGQVTSCLGAELPHGGEGAETSRIS
jgi:hypothetical protein